MPVMDGYEATKILRTGEEWVEDREDEVNGDDKLGERETGIAPMSSTEWLKDIPVIAMTASAIQGDKEKCHDAGMDDYLSKPVEKQKLEDMLVKWVGRRSSAVAD